MAGEEVAIVRAAASALAGVTVKKPRGSHNYDVADVSVDAAVGEDDVVGCEVNGLRYPQSWRDESGRCI